MRYLSLLLLLLLTACGDGRRYSTLMQQADSLLAAGDAPAAYQLLAAADSQIPSYLRSLRMAYELQKAQAQNQAGCTFSSDSTALALVRYYDRLWHSRNRRMTTHYLLGRAHADMGEAAQAIEDYLTAIQCADTASADCDLRTLRAVYGQMAEVYHNQNLLEDELAANQHYINCSWRMNDTLEAINGETLMVPAYYLMGDTAKVLSIAEETARTFQALGYPQLAASSSYITASYIYVKRCELDKAKTYIDLIRRDAGIFDEAGNLLPGREMFYYTMGCFFDACSQLDSAEFYFRKTLETHEYEAAYQGLLAVYQKRHVPDSITKFARLYAEANDKMHRQMNSQTVHRTASLYNYNRHLQEARFHEKNAKERSWAILLLAFIVLLLLAAYKRLQTKKRRKEVALRQLQEQYSFIQTGLEKTIAEKLQMECDQGLALAEKQNEIAELQIQKEHYERLIEILQKQNLLSDYYASEIVQSTLDLSIYRSRCLRQDEVKQLHQLFIHTYPYFCTFVECKTHHFSDNEWYVCILLDLGLRNADICFLLGYEASRVSGLMTQINHVLFGTKGTGNLIPHLREILHSKKEI